jgi:hypothetical protein
MARENIRTQITCPKCKGSDIKLLEVSEEYRVWFQDGEGKIGEEQEPEYGDLIAVRAICQNTDCNHRWTVRGITEITELPNWPSETAEGETAEAPEPVVAPVVAEPEPPALVATETEKVEGKKSGKRGKRADKKAA